MCLTRQVLAFTVIGAMRDRGVPILVVEQNAKKALAWRIGA